MLQKLALGVVIVLGSLLALLTFASLLSSYHWLFDVLTHFNFHYALGLVVCLAFIVTLRSSRLLAVFFALALLVNGYILFPFFWPGSSPSISGEPLRVMSLNVFTDNQDYGRISSYLRETSVDVVFISEIEPELLAMLKQDLSDLYPHIYDESMEGTHGLAMISKYAFTKTETVALDERHHRFLTAELEWQGEPVKLYGAHPHPPLAARWAQSRDDEIQVIGTYLSQEPGAYILLADLNASPWSKPVRQLLLRTRLRHAALGFGIFPTWRYKTVLVAAPLDHILVSPEWQVSFYTLGRDVGSDHVPVIAQLHWSQ